MNDEQKKDMTPEQNPAENAVPEEKPAEDTEKESAVEQAADTEAEKGEESKEAEKKEKRRFGRKPSREEEKIAALEKEKANLNDKFLRICAEYDNFRKRSQKEKDALYGDIKANTVTQFLPVYDNLERALKQNTEDEAYKKGVEMIMTQFCSTLEKIVEVFQKGFKLGDKVIRFAMVKVAN